jgi:hypothetical protein
VSALSQLEPLEAVATREGCIVVVRVTDTQVGSFRVTRLRRRLVILDERTQEWMRPLAEEALKSGESRMAVMTKEVG